MKFISLLVLLVIGCSLNAQIVTIPDANFKNALVNTLCVDLDNDGVNDEDVDTNNDGEIQVTEAEAISNLDVSGEFIGSMSGIERFINLERLECAGNNLTVLDVSDLLGLLRLECNENDLIALDVSENIALDNLDITNNEITEIDLSANTNLRIFSSAENPISELDFSQNILLERIACFNNELTSLDTSNSPLLSWVFIYNNQISSLDFSSNPEMQYLNCRNNSLASLRIDNGFNPNFIWMFADGNPTLNCIQVDDSSFANSQDCPTNNWCKDAATTYNENCDLGVEDVAILEFELSPNPARSLMEVRTTHTIEAIDIYNTAGEKIRTVLHSPIDVSELAPGLYFLSVETSIGTVLNKFTKH